ncbi:MAG: tRNA (guanosine(37)-N1)-methyltransferase TrmD [Porticoccaceae bacterium]|jgi:tRNA (guanine37-N1)-methyltransferase|nr:MAG: tRNA (guanine-N1)-methyltransferase [SAR92 bacterium BACL16 MAG-120619-bin48]KRP27122.1 MAG: tRNA (guanine-N1)-methyltransferase [SAR92 bacterium BACL16 MAG-120322-bin99]MDO7634330.1 tRNA (guanosine(37)-N1)-methyltransferase TrmD [Porticoccaceae bacterium]MDP4653995.1 tRNA (guanosine(37)-N1)-methyltransferase TrmD [Alphaproteobacteria bacterium]MDP4743438.1 tRNA (guanosine(37)-N1)-methyltransferase TrmD [Porticoccaceae bacterium]
MKIALITLFPEMFSALTDYGISGRAIKNGLVQCNSFNPRDFTEDRHQTVDDRPYGGGPGMVMMIEPLRKAISVAKDWAGDDALVVYLSPQGQVLGQQAVNRFATQQSLILIAGRYEGIDERLIALEIDEEWSIGDYVLSGGELPAMVLMDALIRQLPGALGHSDSADQDSFAEGLLDCPHYTRPEDYQGQVVPEVLLSGNHEKIRRWRLQQSLLRTQQRRPDLLDRLELNKEQKALLKEVSAALADDDNG